MHERGVRADVRDRDHPDNDGRRREHERGCGDQDPDEKRSPGDRDGAGHDADERNAREQVAEERRDEVAHERRGDDDRDVCRRPTEPAYHDRHEGHQDGDVRATADRAEEVDAEIAADERGRPVG